MDEMINYLRQFAVITADQANLIGRDVNAIVLRRGDILWEQNQVPQQMAFVASGVLSASTCSNGDDDLIRYFIEEKKFATDIDGFLQRKPVHECIKAVVDSRLLAFTIEAARRLSMSLTNWDNMTKNLSVNCLLEMVIKRAPVSGSDACSRFLVFERRYPGLSSRIPQSVVASYLGLAPATLSRIKNQLK
ncbi:MAG TPA: hypothetical protein VK658_08415 [Chryseolinea sp.]|nr:hypothetical protein [Chryseolinea sp.]